MENALALVRADRAQPSRWMLFLHGILGRGGNLRDVARRVVAQRPDWGAALVDLRMHGRSQGFAPPHAVDAAARDLLTLAGRVPGPIRGVLGHSFGGKVALAYYCLRDRLERVVVLDASPSARGLSPDRSLAEQALALLESLPPTLPARAALVERAVAAGLEPAIGTWLSMNLVSHQGGFRLALDLPALRAMLDDYLAADLWRPLEEPPDPARIDIVIGERAGTFTPADRERLARLAAERPGRLVVHTLPVGHWVHAEDPAGVAGIVAEALVD